MSADDKDVRKDGGNGENDENCDDDYKLQRTASSMSIESEAEDLI